METVTKPKYTRKDFQSDQEVRWCPGCGDYSVLAAMQKALPEMGVEKEKVVFISGIGCSSRFPYYMNTYGFHTIHGRAFAIATGVKIMNPDLSVWVITGDGDGLSIGTNHLIHACRRNVGIKILLFNNEVYGLTKGQVAPTTEQGKVTKSTPWGNIDNPIQGSLLALSAGATFVARTADVLGKHMQEIFIEAYKHKGVAFIEILQNCHIFMDGVFKPILDKEVREEKILFLEKGKPYVFGKNKDKGIQRNKEGKLEVVSLQEVPQENLLVHDKENLEDKQLAMELLLMKEVFAMGIIYQKEEIPYEEKIRLRKKRLIEKRGEGKLEDLLYGGETWKIS